MIRHDIAFRGREQRESTDMEVNGPIFVVNIDLLFNAEKRRCGAGAELRVSHRTPRYLRISASRTMLNGGLRTEKYFVDNPGAMVSEIRQGEGLLDPFRPEEGRCARRTPSVRPDPKRSLQPKGDAKLAGPSVVSVSQVRTVDKTELTGRIGKLSAGALDQVRSGLQLLFDRA